MRNSLRTPESTLENLSPEPIMPSLSAPAWHSSPPVRLARPAALTRRIDHKIEFGNLRTEQAWNLFKRHAPSADDQIRQELANLEGLRLGDFGAVLRGADPQRIADEPTVLLESLRQELRFRPGRALGRRMGL